MDIPSHPLLFWLVTITGAIFAGWWLAVRPGAWMRTIATPVSVLVIVMAVLLCMLTATGRDFEGFSRDVYYSATGR